MYCNTRLKLLSLIFPPKAQVLLATKLQKFYLQEGLVVFVVSVKLGKLKTLEVIIRGDIIERNIVLKLGRKLSETKLRADFSASIVVPPFLKAVEKCYPSICVLHITVDIEDKFQVEKLLKDFLCTEKCEVVSIHEL